MHCDGSGEVCMGQTSERADMHRRCMLTEGKFIENYQFEMNLFAF